MNPTIEPPSQLQPPQPPQPHRLSTSCDRHPEEKFTGFCPSCLCERLAVLDQSSTSASSSKKPPFASTSTAAAALKAIFKPSSSSSNGGFFPELRRTKSFSASKNEAFSGFFEPQRKSCDVRVRNTLCTLFSQDANNNVNTTTNNNNNSERNPKAPVISDTVEPPRISSSSFKGGTLFESPETEKSDDDDDKEDAIRVLEEPNLPARVSNANPIDKIVEEEEDAIVIEAEEGVEEEFKTMKDHIDLVTQRKKPTGRDLKEIAGSFWSAASVFSKKLQKWRQKQKGKKRRNGVPGSATLPVEKPIGRQFRDTQSEIADYGYGRRSCDTDPRFSLDAGRFSLDAGRFSLDAGRISMDDPRYSFDEPRASWDGHLLGRTLPRMPPMVSVVEDDPVNVVARTDTQIPVEEPQPQVVMPADLVAEDESIPGGSAQTRDYYLDSSSRRRKSLDRSSSIRKTAAAVVAEIDELRSVSNAKVSPATVDYCQGPKLVAPSRLSNSNSLKDDCSEIFEMGFRDQASVVSNVESKESKKSRRWTKGWNILGFIYRRSVNKDDDDDRYSKVTGVERSFSESWPELRGERNGEVPGAFNPKMLRSNSSVSWRSSHSFTNGGSFVAPRRSNVETNGHSVRKKREEFVLERNRSARYSPNNMENGPLKFYMAPFGGSQRNGWGKSKPSHAHSIARSVLRLY